jgi:hypothetical protein
LILPISASQVARITGLNLSLYSSLN